MKNTDKKDKVVSSFRTDDKLLKAAKKKAKKENKTLSSVVEGKLLEYISQ